MKNTIKIIFKYLFLFAVGGSLYYIIELLWRGRSHWSMFCLSGIVFIYGGLRNEVLSWEYPFWYQIIETEIFVLISEFLTGCIVNIWLGWDVWDYSNLPGNILGQTSWQFALLFLPLCAVAIFLDDYVRYWFFKEEKPRYNFKLK